MEVTNLNPEELRPYDKNPRINEHAVEKVAKSIKKFGFNQPIVCDQNKVICVGHTRWKAAKQLGLESVPVFLKEMTPEQFIAYNLADNRVGEDSKWDDGLLSELMMELNELDDSFLGFTGFSDDELDALLDDDSLDGLIENVEGVSAAGNVSPHGKSHVRMVQLFLNDDNFKDFISKCEQLQSYYGTENLTETVIKAISEEHNANY